MIYINKGEVNENDFIDLLGKTRQNLLGLLNKKQISPFEFEDGVYVQMGEAAKGTVFHGTVERTGPHGFPDIIAHRFFGVEVKMTIKDQWTSTGNSVLETLRAEDVDRIYIMFGKFGGKPDIRYRLYHECLPEVSVTHSPRYKINMDLELGKSIFDKIGVDYDTLRSDPNPIQKIKDYYRKQLKDGEELWWIDQDAEERSVSPIIRPFRSLKSVEQNNFILESMILFPGIFGNSNTKYERAAAYLIAEYNAVSASFRDLFTAGGQKKIKIEGKSILVPKVAYNLHAMAALIVDKIKTISDTKLSYYWRTEKIERDRVAQWKRLIDQHFILKKNNISASQILESGLYAKDSQLPKS